MAERDIDPPPRAPNDDRGISVFLAQLQNWLGAFRDLERSRVMEGDGAPEGRVVANIATLYLRRDGGAGTCLYVKESGNATATGWVAK